MSGEGGEVVTPIVRDGRMVAYARHLSTHPEAGPDMGWVDLDPVAILSENRCPKCRGSMLGPISAGPALADRVVRVAAEACAKMDEPDYAIVGACPDCAAAQYPDTLVIWIAIDTPAGIAVGCVERAPVADGGDS